MLCVTPLLEAINDASGSNVSAIANAMIKDAYFVICNILYIGVPVSKLHLSACVLTRPSADSDSAVTFPLKKWH